MAVTSTPDRPGVSSIGSALAPLFWLKWKLVRRGFQKSASAVFGIIIICLLFAPLALGMAFGFGAVFVLGPPPWNEHLLRALLLAIAAFWLIVPLLGYSLNDSYDITKLFVFPISVRQIFIGAILGSLLDLSTLLVIPSLIAVIYAYSKSVGAFVVALLVIALFLFHILSLSQGILIATAGVLRSRRFRDFAIVLAPVLWIIYYSLRYSGAGNVVGKINWLAFVQSRTWDLISYLPPGLAARALYAAAHGAWIPSLFYVVALGGITVLTVYVASLLVALSYSGEAVGASRRKPVAAAPAHRPALPVAPAAGVSVSGESRTLFPPVMRAIIDKELLYMRRDPAFKVTIVNLAYFVVIFIFSFGRLHSNFWLMWTITGLLLLREMSIFYNIFGGEGAAAPLFFAFPASRRQMLLGKNLVHFTLYTAINIIFVTVLAIIEKGQDSLGLLLFWVVSGVILYIGVGNLISIRFPLRVVVRSMRAGRNTAGGVGYAFLYMGISLASSLFLLPILAALLIPKLFIPPIWYLLTLPLAAAYTAAVYLFSLHLAVPLLLEREQEIVAKVSASVA